MAFGDIQKSKDLGGAVSGLLDVSGSAPADGHWVNVGFEPSAVLVVANTGAHDLYLVGDVDFGGVQFSSTGAPQYLPAGVIDAFVYTGNDSTNPLIQPEPPVARGFHLSQAYMGSATGDQIFFIAWR